MPSTTLHSQILSCNWPQALSLLSTTPTLSQTPDDSHNTPLHRAIEFHAPPELLLTLLHLHPAAVSVANKYGELPLHCAAYAGDVPPEILTEIIRGFPEALDRRDYWGKVPRDHLPERKDGGEERKEWEEILERPMQYWVRLDERERVVSVLKEEFYPIVQQLEKKIAVATVSSQKGEHALMRLLHAFEKSVYDSQRHLEQDIKKLSKSVGKLDEEEETGHKVVVKVADLEGRVF